MSVPAFTMRELIDAGVHFGHKKKRWNPVMAPYIHSTRNGVHIIDLQQTVPMLYRALTAARSVAQRQGRILFVGTKRQASEAVAEAAKRCGQYYVNSRWLGGMLTNWSTIQNSIRQLKKFEEMLADTDSGLTKKERLNLQRQCDKLERSLGGIRDMSRLPDMIFVIDTNREDLAIKEAKRLGIPIAAIVDTNASPENIDLPIPGNDDASRAIKLYCKLMSDAALSGLKEGVVDVSAEAPADTDKPEAKAETPEAEKPAPKAKTEKTPKAEAKKKPATKKATASKTEKNPVARATKKEAMADEAKKAASKPKATKAKASKDSDDKTKSDEAA